LGLFAAAIVACGPGALDPSEEEPSPAGISFGLEEGTFGAHYADQRLPSDPNPLTDEFAVAVPDSVDGLVLLAYDGGTSNLFILQVSSTAKGTYACGPVTGGHPCHARFFENVREQDGVVEVEGRLDLTSGTLTLSQVGPDDVTGAFEAHFERTGGQGGSTIDVFHGTIAVDLLQGPVEKGGLGCLVALTVGATECS
jgi:hypothetical protein